jgi:hypothetical protein
MSEMLGAKTTMTTVNNILELAIEHYGEDHQVIKAMEELGELIAQLAKRSNETGLRINLLNEIADASIMIEQLKIIFGQDLIHNIQIDKIQRLKSRIQEDLAARMLSGAT